MLTDHLARAAAFHALHPLFCAGFDYLRHFNPATPDGKHLIDGDRIFALPQRYDTAPAVEKRFEAHRRYIDIQYILSGEEVIQHAPLERLTTVLDPYDEARDVAFFADPDGFSSTLLRAGDWAIYFPHDGHKPCCAASASVHVRKIVIKIAV